MQLLHDRGRVVGLDLGDLPLEIGTSRTAEEASEARGGRWLLRFRWRQALGRRSAAWRGLRVGAEGADFGCGAGASCLRVGNFGCGANCECGASPGASGLCVGKLGDEFGGFGGKLGG